ncbi:MAG TPA: hypothetical protein VF167_17010 [Longimicrobiaceae bacterium]
MKRNLILLTLGLAACGTPAPPPGPGPTVVTPTMLQPPPVYALIGHRDRLELTSQQIEQLDSIAVDLEQKNSDLIDELEERAVPTRNRMGMVLDEEGTPILEQIRDNNRAASEAVGRLLSTTQQAEACELFSLNNRRRERPRIRGADEEEADSIWQMLETRVWPWCGQSSRAEADTAP